MKINLYFEEGPGAKTIRAMVSNWITSIGDRLGVNIYNISIVGIAFSETYGEAITDLFGNSGYTNNDGYVGVGKSHTSFIDNVPLHTVLFHGCIFEMILSGINDSGSSNVFDWKPELQFGHFIIAHELGHCRNNELYHWPATQPLQFPRGFDLDEVHKYYFNILVEEIGACLHADRFYSKELLLYTFDNDCKYLANHKLEYETEKSQHRDDQIFRVACIGSSLIWLYLIQFSKIIVGKLGTSFESESLNCFFADLPSMEFLHPQITNTVSSFSSTYPNEVETFRKEIETIWERMCEIFKIKFIKDAEGWCCYWN